MLKQANPWLIWGFACFSCVERPGWLHRIGVGAGTGWVITEQVRTVTTHRFRRPAPDIELSDHELAEVRRVLARMLL